MSRRGFTGRREANARPAELALAELARAAGWRLHPSNTWYKTDPEGPCVTVWVGGDRIHLRRSGDSFHIAVFSTARLTIRTTTSLPEAMQAPGIRYAAFLAIRRQYDFDVIPTPW